MGRRISGSVSTVVSQRGLKKRQTRGSRQRSLMGSESTAPAQLLKGSADIVVGPPPPRVRTPHPTKESGETDESVEVVVILPGDSCLLIDVFVFGYDRPLIKKAGAQAVVLLSVIKRVDYQHQPMEGKHRQCPVLTVMSRLIVPVNWM